VEQVAAVLTAKGSIAAATYLICITLVHAGYLQRDRECEF